MSHFEFVSVALALIFSLAASRLLAALPLLLAPGTRYWTSVAWALVLLLNLVVSWWFVWNMREVSWSPLRFVWALSIPALIHLRTSVLVSGSPTTVQSWRDQYFIARVPYFSLGAASALSGALTPWVMGNAAWFTLQPLHSIAGASFAMQMAGLLSANPTLHGILAGATLVANLLLLFAVGQILE